MNKAILNVDLFYGDQGKGTTVEFQTRQTNSKLTVRFNGGAQAAHNIVLNDGRHHTFAQFGSGTFESDVKTYLSEFVLVNPFAMENEEQHLRECNVYDAFNRMFIHRNALLTTPYHRADNRIKELWRGGSMHGSCGMGISATVEDSISRPDECLRVKDLQNDAELLRKLKLNRLAMIESSKAFVIKNNPLVDRELSTFDEELIDVIYNRLRTFREKVVIVDDSAAFQLFEQTPVVVFEPAQGVLLDENYGFHPYTTWTTCTLKNARTILQNLGFKDKIETYGVTRIFGTRHGPGPFVTEDKSDLTNSLADVHNTTNIWQRNFRCGWLDLVALNYSLRVNGPVDYLSVTHVDWLHTKRSEWLVCDKYMLNGVEIIPFIPKSMEDQILLTELMCNVVPSYKSYKSNEVLYAIENALKTPIKILSHGPRYEDKTTNIKYEGI